MNAVVRNDLRDVEGLISRLLSIGETFRKNDQDWSHLKNREDWDRIDRASDGRKKVQVERIYSDGRDMAFFMSDALCGINHDFTKYPTLTSIINGFKSTWVYSDLESVLAAGRAAHDELQLNNWAFSQMATLFQGQIDLANAVRQTLDMLRATDLYKQENGLPVDNDKVGVTIQNVSHSAISVHSSGVTQTITSDSSVFAELIKALQASHIEERDQLVGLVEEMSREHKGGNFISAYKKFMDAAATHITVLAPFLPTLASLL